MKSVWKFIRELHNHLQIQTIDEQQNEYRHEDEDISSLNRAVVIYETKVGLLTKKDKDIYGPKKIEEEYQTLMNME